MWMGSYNLLLHSGWGIPTFYYFLAEELQPSPTFWPSRGDISSSHFLSFKGYTPFSYLLTLSPSFWLSGWLHLVSYLLALWVAAPVKTPMLARGFFNAFCSSLRDLPAYWKLKTTSETSSTFTKCSCMKSWRTGNARTAKSKAAKANGATRDLTPINRAGHIRAKQNQ